MYAGKYERYAWEDFTLVKLKQWLDGAHFRCSHNDEQDESIIEYHIFYCSAFGNFRKRILR